MIDQNAAWEAVREQKEFVNLRSLILELTNWTQREAIPVSV